LDVIASTQYRIFIGEKIMVTTKKATTKKKPVVKTDWLGRPIKRATKAYSKKVAHPPTARASTTTKRARKRK